MQMIQQQFEGHQIRVIQRDGQPWFVLADVCEVLEIKQAVRVAGRLDEDEVTQTHVTDSLGRQQETYIVNESGLYAVILRSDKPQARPFRKWVTNEVLPTLRREGSYTISPQPAPAADFSELERLAGLTAQAITVAKAEIRIEVTAEIDSRLGELPITGAAKNEIYQRVKKLAGLMGGRRSDYQAAWTAFKTRYNLAGYGDLPSRLQPDAVRFVDGLIAAYTPNENLLLTAVQS